MYWTVSDSESENWLKKELAHSDFLHEEYVFYMWADWWESAPHRLSC